VRERTAPDYRGHTDDLMMQRASIRTRDRVLLVDDWIETGNQARAVAHMVSRCHATLVAVSVLVDQLPDAARRELPQVSTLVRFPDLPPMQ
jgi:adenine phosphoribosyltransferase